MCTRLLRGFHQNLLLVVRLDLEHLKRYCLPWKSVKHFPYGFLISSTSLAYFIIRGTSRRAEGRRTDSSSWLTCNPVPTWVTKGNGFLHRNSRFLPRSSRCPSFLHSDILSYLYTYTINKRQEADRSCYMFHCV